MNKNLIRLRFSIFRNFLLILNLVYEKSEFLWNWKINMVSEDTLFWDFKHFANLLMQVKGNEKRRIEL